MTSISDTNVTPFDPATTTRPVPVLMKYYLVTSLFVPPVFPFILLGLYFKYKSLRYKFDDEGVSMSWGVLFKREVYLTYRRIQDIHVSRGIIQRQFGLATVSVQTASGSIGAQMTLDGIGDPEGLRDYLYSKMRGSKGEAPKVDGTDAEAGVAEVGHDDEALGLLKDILNELRSQREARSNGGGRP